MATVAKLSHTAAMILQAIDAGLIYGFSIMETTGLPSGTVYPAMRRLERDKLIGSRWERQSIADAEQRPPRKYYKLTTAGSEALQASRKSLPVAGTHDPDCRGEVAMTPHSEQAFQAIDRNSLFASSCCRKDIGAEWRLEWESELWHARRSNGGPGTASWPTEREIACFVSELFRTRCV